MFGSVGQPAFAAVFNCIYRARERCAWPDTRYMHLSPAALDAALRLLETWTETSRWAVEK